MSITVDFLNFGLFLPPPLVQGYLPMASYQFRATIVALPFRHNFIPPSVTLFVVDAPRQNNPSTTCESSLFWLRQAGACNTGTLPIRLVFKHGQL